MDFTNCYANKYRPYGGKHGSKLCINYKDELWMLKFPTKFPDFDGYNNAVFSEYIGSKIYKELGISVQEVLLGTYTIKEKEQVCVACKDFEVDGYRLFDFGMIKNSVLDCPGGGYSRDIKNILRAIRLQELVDSDELRRRFWQIFIVDAWLGNYHRHAANWGVLINQEERLAKIAPVFDQGECLFPYIKEEKMISVLESESKKGFKSFKKPESILRYKCKKIDYIDFLVDEKYDDLTEILIEINKKIDMDRIFKIVDQTEYISETQKEFYKFLLLSRREGIIRLSIDIINRRHRNTKGESRN